MKRVYKNVNGIITEVLTLGDPFGDSIENVIVCITGNPGVPDFYIDFATELYKTLQLPICIIGHAGHIEIPKERFCVLPKDDGLYDLKTQVEHKLDLLQNHISKNAKIHLIGHSIGAWIIIEILQNNDHLMERLSSVNLLFPTLQRMAESKNGIFFNNIFRKVYVFILFLISFLYILPEFILRMLVNFYLKIKCMPYKYGKWILRLTHPLVIKNIIFMAFDELDTVQVLNSDGLTKIKHLTCVIYGKNDGWAPLEFIEDLRKFEPCLKMILAHNVEHAFVLKSSEQIATMVADFIQSKSKVKVINGI